MKAEFILPMFIAACGGGLIGFLIVVVNKPWRHDRHEDIEQHKHIVIRGKDE